MVYSRRLQYADRVALQQADQAIHKDVLRALQVGRQNTPVVFTPTIKVPSNAASRLSKAMYSTF